MRRREFIALLGGTAAWPFAAHAQQKAVVIGFLGAGTAAKSTSMVGAIKQGLRDNGLVEGKEYIFEQRWANGEYERFPAFARDLVEQKAGVIIVTTIAAARAAQRETSVIPIVMGMINDPVGNGLVTSLARPGGNTTGMASLNEDITPKMLESLKKTDDKVSDPKSERKPGELTPEYARNEFRSIKPEVLVVVGICSHLGCSPSDKLNPASEPFDATWGGGFYCPCHGSLFDLAGRVYKNKPAPDNLQVPPHTYLSDNKLLIGEDKIRKGA